MADPFCVVHALTTGGLRAEDSLIELAAVRVGAGGEETFQCLCRQRGDLPLHIRQLAGLEDGDFAGAPDEDRALSDLFDFVGDDPVVAVEVDALLRYLRGRAGRRRGPSGIDVVDLACFVIPTAGSFDLATLCGLAGVPAPGERALDTARATAAVWQHLAGRLLELPLPVLAMAVTVLEPTDHPLRALLAEAETASLSKNLLGPTQYAELLKDFSPFLGIRPAVTPGAAPEKLDADGICALFEPDGTLSQSLAGYEYREEQVAMIREVCRAYNAGSILLVEAGTGTGKSLAYLIPSVLWAKKNGQRVVVSTNTKNLQEQLFSKDVPLIRRMLRAAGEAASEFRCAVIKGRANYLCMHKLLNLFQEIDRELAPEERADLLPLVAWAVETDTGDLSENGGFMHRPNWDIWTRVGALYPEECNGPRCRRAKHCFLRRARSLSLNADVVVANHAVVFSEMGIDDSAVLPPYDHLIFDEGHNIENVATEHLGLRLSAFDVMRVLNRLNRAGRDGAGRGLFTNMRFQLARAGELGEDGAQLADDIPRALADMDAVAAAMQQFFGAVAAVCEGAGGRGDRLRYDAYDRRPREWDRVETAAGDFGQALKRLADRLSAMQTRLGDMDDEVDYKQDFVRSLGAEAAAVSDLLSTLGMVVEAKESAYVYWIEQRRRRGRRRDAAYEAQLCAAPLEIAAVMAAHLYGKKSTLILSSATLTVDGEFDFMLARLGLDEYEANEPGRVRTAALGSSFDFERQVLLGVPVFLPEPARQAGSFEEHLASMLGNLLTATRGRGLVLFTSYDMLNRTYPPVKETLERAGIVTLGQGLDGERSKLMHYFTRNVSSVLLGTQSFWEGVDIPGEALTCLVLAKLPFQVVNDPIVEARCELLRSRGRDPFNEYSVPHAVIRLKQGFGRLIRSRTDVGIIVVCDKRVATRGYGRRFLHSLPAPAKVFTGEADLLDEVRSFLERHHTN